MKNKFKKIICKCDSPSTFPKVMWKGIFHLKHEHNVEIILHLKSTARDVTKVQFVMQDFLTLFNFLLMGKSHNVKWIYCVSVAEREKRWAPVHCRATWSGGNHGEALLSPFLSLFSWTTCFSETRCGHISVHVALEDWFSLLCNMKTDKTVRTGAHTKWLQAL